ncbi:hypothetical protein D3C71_1963030 [compost metagenome]
MYRVILLQLIKFTKSILCDEHGQTVTACNAAQTYSQSDRINGPVPIGGLQIRIGRRLIQPGQAG